MHHVRAATIRTLGRFYMRLLRFSRQLLLLQLYSRLFSNNRMFLLSKFLFLLFLVASVSVKVRR